jgi:hypothetical protein
VIGSPTYILPPDENGDPDDHLATTPAIRTFAYPGPTPVGAISIVADRAVSPGTVKLRNFDITTNTDPEYGWSAALTVGQAEDNLGRVFSYVTHPASGTPPGKTAPKGNYWVSWTGTGGIPNRRHTGPMEDAGEILEWMLSRSDLVIDRGRTGAAVDQLRGFKLAGYVDDPEITVEEWIRSNLLPILPITMRTGPHGVYPLVLRWQARHTDAVATLDTGRRDCWRLGGVRTEGTEDVASEIRLSYALDANTGKYTATLTLHGDPDLDAELRRNGGTNRVVLNRACMIARSRRPDSTAQVYAIETDWIYDDATAFRVAAWLASDRALPKQLIDLEVAPEYGYLQVGDVVTVTDPDLWLSDVVGIVVGRDPLATSTIPVSVRLLDPRVT